MVKGETVVNRAEDNITVTPKQLGIAVAVLVAFIGAVPTGLNQLFVVRADPFTGTEGRALAARITSIEQWVYRHETFARDRSILQAETDARQDARIEELFRHPNN